MPEKPSGEMPKPSPEISVESLEAARQPVNDQIIDLRDKISRYGKPKAQESLREILRLVEDQLEDLYSHGYTVKIDRGEDAENRLSGFSIVIERGNNSVRVAAGNLEVGNTGTYTQELLGILKGLIEAVKLAEKEKYRSDLTY